MLTRYHGEPITLSVAKSLPKTMPLDGPSVGFMFGDLAKDEANRLPTGPATIAALKTLGKAMAEDQSNAESRIPAAYTYFGQFIDHDISKTLFTDPSHENGSIFENDNFSQIPAEDIGAAAKNIRSPVLDLDSLYRGLAEEALDPDGGMKLGTVSPAGDGSGTIPTAEKTHDLPRRPMIPNPRPEQLEADRQALIGDPRNDENLLVAQLHVALLRSHNVLVRERKMDRVAAETAVRRRYQWAVLHDFLPRVCAPDVVTDVIQNEPRFWTVKYPKDLFMPLEFSAAAYRFGHSMVRQEYSHNTTFSRDSGALAPATFNFLFTFTALSGSISPVAGPSSQFPTLPDNWIIDWPRFFSPAGQPDQPGRNPARRIDTHIAPELGRLPDFIGREITNVLGELASRNLLRGYLLGLPTGQAVAAMIGIEPLAAEVLRAALPATVAETIEAAGLLERTPLWFYVLAEAGDASGPDGQHLGPVGSRILAETFWNLINHAQDSVIVAPPTADELATGEFTLKGLVKIGQDAGMPPLATDLIS